ncbi:MAG: UvrD-helicase domain-containing protein [Pseudomonadota bacterium]
MAQFTHQAICASAGSGKTFKLAHRYISMVAHGVGPDRIIALTFSRKAAGEIFASIVGYLVAAALDDGKAARTADEIGRPGMGRGEFLGLLRAMTGSMHRLHIGTLDSFAVGAVKTFPFELGVGARFEVMDDKGARAWDVHRDVLASLMSPEGAEGAEGGGGAVFEELMESFARAAYGKDVKSLDRPLEQLINEHRPYYRILPREDAWGNVDVLRRSEAVDGTDDQGIIDEAAAGMAALLEREGVEGKVFERWKIFADAVRRFSASSPWTREIGYMVEKLCPAARDLERGEAEISIERKKHRLGGEAARLALLLLRRVLAVEIGKAVEQTRGIYRFVREYETAYDAMVRRRGSLTFGDVQFLLTAGNESSGGALLSRRSSEERRLLMDFRLDCGLDHWLIDEFQDTSDLQWEVLRAVADEILRDASGRRSFFYVGDVKQSIYGWRGGNPRLFELLADRYAAIERKPLVKSFRSAEPVISTVNRAFGRLPDDFRESVRRRWQEAWDEHTFEPGAVPETGHAALLEPSSQGGKRTPAAEERYAILAGLLKEIDPVGRGLSAAVLVRSNDSGRAVVDFLRRECPGSAVVHEGMAGITDSPVVGVLLSLVKLAAHPGDTFALRHVQMSPLFKAMKKMKLDWERLPVVLLRKIHEAGFQGLVREWGSRLDRAAGLDAFGRKRLNDLAAAAAELDESGERSAIRFVRFVEGRQIRETAGGGAVRVMTVHQAKGLGFDVVFIVDPGTRDIRRDEPSFILARDASTDRPLWAMKSPRRIIAACDPVLGAQVEESDDRACFESLCVLYVAMTRAKSALYMITAWPGKDSAALRPDTFLRQQLTGEPKHADGPRRMVGGQECLCLYEAGRRDWYETVAVEERPGPRAGQEPAGAPERLAEFAAAPSSRIRLTPVEPSKAGQAPVRAAGLFNPEARGVLEFGIAIHELFSSVSWIDETDTDRVVRQWQASSGLPARIRKEIADQFRGALGSSAVRKALARPQERAELWREKSFEVVLGDRWVSGAFDRVTILRGERDEPLEAAVLDYKSDRVESASQARRAAKAYEGQMGLYREALAKITGLDPATISLRLLFTRPGVIVDLD